MFSETTKLWLSDHGFDPKNIDGIGRYDDTALIVACRRGKAFVAKELIDAGANVNHRNMDGTNALWACVVSDSFATADLLLNNGVDINNQNDNGATTIMYAASAGKTPWVKFLLERGANTEVKSLDDFTALDLASNIDCLRLLKAAYKKKKNQTLEAPSTT